jgi:hypothetical protein
MNKRIVAIILVVAALGLLGYWYSQGHHMWSQDKVMVEEKDELFGTTSQKWVDKNQLGLEYIGPAAGILLVAAGWLAWSASRQKRLAASS